MCIKNTYPIGLCMLSFFDHVWLFATLWTIADQAPLSMGFSRQEYCSGLPCPSPGDCPYSEIQPVSLGPPALADRFFTTTSIWEAHTVVQFSSVAQLCLTLCDPMDWSTPGFPVHHQLPEFTQSCPLSQWCHPTISSSAVPFSSHLQSFLASGSYLVSQFFVSGGQNISFNFSISPSNEYSGLIFIGRISWISL